MWISFIFGAVTGAVRGSSSDSNSRMFGGRKGEGYRSGPRATSVSGSNYPLSFSPGHCAGNHSTNTEAAAILDDLIHRRQKAEEALHQAREQLAHVARIATLGELTASIAHVVNQPLTA